MVLFKRHLGLLVILQVAVLVSATSRNFIPLRKRADDGGNAGGSSGATTSTADDVKLAPKGKLYTVDELWAIVEKDLPVKKAPDTKVAEGPFEIVLADKAPWAKPLVSSCDVSGRKFPKGFKYAVASSAAQIEGGVKEGGRGPSVWDYMAHVHNDGIRGGGTPDVATNSYYRYLEDIARIKAMGVAAYHFSISWSRILPLGRGEVSKEGLDYYDRVIDALIKNGIEPMVTLQHWDVPLGLELSYGSYRDAQIVRDFEAYARIVLERWGTKVKHWVSHNEPLVFCSRFAHTLPLNGTNPTDLDDQQSVYACAYQVLKCHGAMNQVFQELKKSGKVADDAELGIKLDNSYPLPWDEDSDLDKEACVRHEAFNVGLWAQPMYGTGDWPDVVKSTIPPTILPNITEEDKKLIHGSADFLDLDLYNVRIAKALPAERFAACKGNVSDPAWPICSDTSDPWYYQGFKNGRTTGQQADPAAGWLFSTAAALRWYALKVKEMYPTRKGYFISEFGFAEPFEYNKTGLHQIVEDTARAQYMVDYVSEILLSTVDDGVPWRGMAAWSLMDNFEWYLGETLPFGLQYVNFSSPGLERTYKRSFYELRDVFDKYLDGGIGGSSAGNGNGDKKGDNGGK